VPPEVLARGFHPGAEVYTHDQLHEVLAYSPGTPVYTTMKRDQSTVRIDRKLFEAAGELRIFAHVSLGFARARQFSSSSSCEVRLASGPSRASFPG
jgi:hypothetical protein